MKTIKNLRPHPERSPIGNQRGAVLVVGLLLLSALSLVAGIFLLLSNTERGIAHNSMAEISAFYVAEAGIQRGLPYLRQYVDHTVLNNTMAAASVTPATINSYVTNNDPAAFLVAYARPAGLPTFTKVNNTTATLSLPASDLPAGTGTYSATIEVVANGAPTHTTPLANTDVYVFPYLYTITSNGSVSPGFRSITASGDFTLTTTLVTTPGAPPSGVWNSFARYALFTETQTNAEGKEVWFTNHGRFTGPVHTNGHFHFANNPSATFIGEAVTSVSQTAEFYNNGNNIMLNADNNGNIDRPLFYGGATFTRGVASIPMPTFTTANAQKSIALFGSASQTVPSSLPNGIYMGADANNNMVGGIYVKGNASVTPGVSGGNATYTITQGSTTMVVTVDRSSNSTTVQTMGGSTQTFTGVPNGMLYVDGQITSLSGVLGHGEQTTIAATNQIMLTGNLTYQHFNPNSNPPTSPPTPDASGMNTVLGVLSWNGNVKISSSLANDISLHGIVMCPNGEFCVENYQSIPAKGWMTLLGGVIQKTYGAFGIFSGSTLTHGYMRNFVYDQRMLQGTSPPFFPTTENTLTPGRSPVCIPSNAVSASINNRPTWRERF